MANTYDKDTDPRMGGEEYVQPPAPQYTLRPTAVMMPAVKGQLNMALASAIQEAQALANYYDNVAKQLTLLASQVEHTK